MKFQEAIGKCHVRSAIYRESNPEKKYWKNHQVPLSARIPFKDHIHTDWEEYDPRDDYDCSIF